MRLVFDMESNNLLDNVEHCWCIVAKDIDTDKMYYFKPEDIQHGLLFLQSSDTLIGHNIIKFDLPVFKKLHNFEYTGELIDTLVVSRLLNPDRPKPEGYIGKAPHSVEAWGVRFGHKKPEHEDWSKFTEEMLYRCEQDVLITEKIFYALEEEKNK